MADLKLPPVTRVRISSEGAEGIALTPVVAKDMATVELVGQILGVTGKDAPRVIDVLCRGSLVVGGSRFRWASFDCELEDVVEYLKDFPDSDPSRVFDPLRCHLAAFRSGARSIVIERRDGEKRRMFKKRSFWDELMEMAKPEYREYSYREQADQYRWRVDSQDRLHEAAKLLTWSSYETQLRSGSFDTVDLYCKR
jgi:hypothetical protein